MKRRLLDWAVILTALILTIILSGQERCNLPLVEGAYYYQNGILLKKGAHPDFKKDVKMLERQENADTLTNYAEGYALSLPAGLSYDFSRMVSKVDSDDFVCVISKEHSPYQDVDEYLAFYQNRLYVNEQYLTLNSMTVNADTTIVTAGYETRLISLTHQSENPASPLQTYTFAYQKTGGQTYMRYLFKGIQYGESYLANCMNILNSFQKIAAIGTVSSGFSAAPVKSPLWNQETLALYERLCKQDKVDWGIFTADIYDNGIQKTIPALETYLGKKFEVVLMYRMLGVEIPREGLEAAQEKGKTIELTIQVSDNNNEDIYACTPMFDLIDGKRDDEIRALAAQIKAFGHPILFRLNNEMNSDWTSYSGIVTLSDPDLYIAAWRHIYDIFSEENVQNAIWIFNPNDKSYPPSQWNHFINYYPGNDYVQMIGLTGYNTGSYYHDVTGETWREFDEIYSEISGKYLPYFSDFPWIVTEFGSSSYGGNKAQWIRNMFQNIRKYKNIKIAVWWSYADYDLREGNEGIAARPYFLDETPETLEAFKQGRSGE